jgi:hypothetical protein
VHHLNYLLKIEKDENKSKFAEIGLKMIIRRYKIDNGWVKRMVRKFATSRNNWMCFQYCLALFHIGTLNGSKSQLSRVVTDSGSGLRPCAEHAYDLLKE